MSSTVYFSPLLQLKRYFVWSIVRHSVGSTCVRSFCSGGLLCFLVSQAPPLCTCFHLVTCFLLPVFDKVRDHILQAALLPCLGVLAVKVRVRLGVIRRPASWCSPLGFVAQDGIAVNQDIRNGRLHRSHTFKTKVFSSAADIAYSLRLIRPRLNTNSLHRLYSVIFLPPATDIVT